MKWSEKKGGPEVYTYLKSKGEGKGRKEKLNRLQCFKVRRTFSALGIRSATSQKKGECVKALSPTAWASEVKRRSRHLNHSREKIELKGNRRKKAKNGPESAGSAAVRMFRREGTKARCLELTWEVRQREKQKTECSFYGKVQNQRKRAGINSTKDILYPGGRNAARVRSKWQMKEEGTISLDFRLRAKRTGQKEIFLEYHVLRQNARGDKKKEIEETSGLSLHTYTDAQRVWSRKGKRVMICVTGRAIKKKRSEQKKWKRK